MTRALLPLCSLAPLLASGQYFDQNFDGTSFDPIPYVFDTTPGNLWQVGPPQKGLFNAALSSPNVMVTDTLNTYPANNASSVTMKVPTYGFWGWSVFFLRFYHAFDTDTLQEGGYVEISWDNGGSWTNIFEDWLMPLNIENYYTSPWEAFEADTLSNGQIGYSGRSGGVTSGLRWAYSSFCWETIGFPAADSLFVRFNFFSDSIPEFRDGWMIDDVTLGAYFTHPVIAYTQMDDYFKVAPNPIEDRLMIIYDLDEERNNVSLALYDVQGRLLKVLREGTMPRRVDHLLIWRNELPDTEGMLLLRAEINGRRYEEKLILAQGTEPVDVSGYIWTFPHGAIPTIPVRDPIFSFSMSKSVVEFDYNTQRPRLIIPEYGRHVQRMVEHCMTIEDRAERTRIAKAIIAVIGRLSPMLRNNEDGDHTLWDHLYIMSDFKLDVDGPFPKPKPEELESKPERLQYPKQRIRFGHYGKIVERFIAKVGEMPEGPEKDNAVVAIGNLMKRQFLAWNRDSVGDEVIIKDLKELSEGRLCLKDDVVLANTADLLRAHSVGPRNEAGFERGGGKRRNKRNRSRGKKRY